MRSVLPISAGLLLGAGCSPPGDRSDASPADRTSGSAPVPLTLCVDPNNLPFSSRGGEGFEVALGRLVATELQRPFATHWHAQRRGAIRETLNARRCDLIPGIVASSERVLTTRPYYRSTYVFVTHRRGPSAARRIVSLDDPALRTLRLGVHMIGDDYTNAPPAHALANRGIVRNVRGYSLYGDYTSPDPPLDLLRAVTSAEIDMAIVWGPFAGWAAQRDSQLVWRAVAPQIDVPFLPFVYDIAMGVRRSDPELRDSVDAVLARRAPSVDSILAAYGVPRVDRLPTTALRATP